MATLSPKLASELAFGVYAIRESGNIKRASIGSISKHISLQEQLVGKTGGYIFNKQTGFAILGLGKGVYSGDAVIAIRGTAMTSGHDWSTNAQIGLRGTVNGQTAHAGFIRTFHSLRPQLEKFLNDWHKGGKGRGTVHCVGHSLGGALATLTADWIAGGKLASQVNLYTFGAPRVGLQGFALANTHRVNHIYRCTHGADPVPKIPLWPFMHSPYKGIEYRLDSSQGMNRFAHGMDPDDGAIPGYLASAKKGQWGDLRQAASEYLHPVRLDYDKRNQASYSDYWMQKLSAALITLLKDTKYYAAIALQGAICAGATFYDLIAQTLEKIAAAGEKAAAQVKGLLGHMLVFAGSAVTTVKDLTYATIRAIFTKMLNRLYRDVKEALKSTFRD
ncbi:lipase family protein [Vibrio cincinnatiensis]